MILIVCIKGHLITKFNDHSYYNSEEKEEVGMESITPFQVLTASNLPREIGLIKIFDVPEVAHRMNNPCTDLYLSLSFLIDVSVFSV